LRELNEMIAADREYYHLQMEMYAQHAAWVLTPNAKKGSVIKATDLYKRPGHKAVRKLTLKERFDYGRDDGSTR